MQHFGYIVPLEEE